MKTKQIIHYIDPEHERSIFKTGMVLTLICTLNGINISDYIIRS